MTEQLGRTKKGEFSYHAENNTGPRRFLICEFDSGPLDQQAALLWQLAQYAPLVVVVFSGSKSLHGFFFCEGQPEEKLQKFFNYATSLGADPRTWLRSQFVRMPEGRRNGEFDARKADEALLAAGITLPPRRQRVLYFNPEVVR
jgi:hypothetical protein